MPWHPDDGHVIEPPAAQVKSVRELPSFRIVKSRESMYDSMVLMHARNDGVMFDNSSGEFKMLIRCNQEDVDDPTEECEFEVCICSEENEDLEEVLKYELEGCFDDEDCDLYVVRSVRVSKISALKAEDPKVGALMTLVNEVHEWRLCQCGKGFAKLNSDQECLRCVLTASESERAAMACKDAEVCVVCQEVGGIRWTKRMKCCDCLVHKRCFGRWMDRQEVCPHCRAIVADRVEAVIAAIDL